MKRKDRVVAFTDLVKRKVRSLDQFQQLLQEAGVGPSGSPLHIPVTADIRAEQRIVMILQKFYNNFSDVELIQANPRSAVKLNDIFVNLKVSKDFKGLLQGVP